jgi:cellulose synthase/poly-beta-1,6-N-acetylglucosamine synthase-like glycosyltransferase
MGEVHDVAVLIACRNGESNIGATVRAASRNGCRVFVVSDASSDDTADVASLAGAEVLVLESNVGKPRALFLGYEHFDLSARFQAVAILDDDVIIESDFVTRSIEKMDLNTAIVVGKNLTLWPKKHRWNVWLAKRSYSYWNYQLIIRRLQSFFGVMSCISGSNSVYRTELLDKVLPERPPYIVDDTFWVLEAQRKDYGRIVYAPKARAHLQDPTNFHDWYKQNLRWLWGTFQGIVGHDVGKKRTRFDVAYVFLIIQWSIYVCFLPFSLWFMFTTGSYYIFLGFYMVWVAAAALQLRQFRLILFAPAIIVVDLIYRVVFIHAVIKTLRQPTVENCVWDSPARFTTN